MGKKRVTKQTKEELLKQQDGMDVKLAEGGGPEEGKPEGSKPEEGKQEASKKTFSIRRGNIYIRASYNNVMITVTDEKGNVLSWASSGAVGFKGPKKATPFAASKSVEIAFERLGKVQIEELVVFVNGVGSPRDAALRAVAGRGIHIVSIRDITPIPHNGCRPRKVRRV